MSKKANQKQKTSPATIDVNHSPKSGDQHRIRWRIACIAPAITVLLASFLFPANRIHEDEIYWIGSSYYYQLAVVEGDASNPDWQLLPARENPVLGKSVIGLALQIAGHPVTTRRGAGLRLSGRYADNDAKVQFGRPLCDWRGFRPSPEALQG